jgi:uncharacterized phage protein (TIGR02218 family)
VTIKSGKQALQNQKWRKAQTLCTVFKVTRTDGYILRFTDHDRTLTLDGEEYNPTSVTKISAERRESDLKSSNQEASGIVDGTVIVIPDLLGDKYRGAKVEQSIIDWRRPWVWHYKATKRIRMMSYDGSGWIATLEGITTQLKQPVGGRFGGVHSQQCTYTLGDAVTCKADITDDLIYNETAITVQTSGTTPILIAVSGTPWTTNQWAGYYFHMRNGEQRGQERRVLSNTSSVLTLDNALNAAPLASQVGWLGIGPRVSSVVTSRMSFVINASDFPTASSYDNDFFRDGEFEWTTGDNAGTVSPIVGYEASTRTVSLLLPTPFDIDVNDRGVMRPGCDGLLGTCVAKFRQFPYKQGSVTGVGTTTVVNDSAASMTTNQFQNGNFFLRIDSGPLYGEQQPIASNTATQFTVSAPFSAAPGVGVTYKVIKTNAENFGGTDVYSPGANNTLKQLEQ